MNKCAACDKNFQDDDIEMFQDSFFNAAGNFGCLTYWLCKRCVGLKKKYNDIKDNELFFKKFLRGDVLWPKACKHDFLEFMREVNRITEKKSKLSANERGEFQSLYKVINNLYKKERAKRPEESA